MAGVSWVTGSNMVRTSGTSLNATTPAGIADDDILLAWVQSRSALTPPAGWTLVVSHSCLGQTSTITQTISLYRKDTVTAADSSTAYTWSQASSSEIAVIYNVLRAESGAGVVRATTTANTDNTNSTAITPGALTTDRDAEVMLIGATTILASGSGYTPTPPTGFTLSSGGSLANYRVMSARRLYGAGSTNSGTFTLLSSGTNGGLAAITARVTDVQEELFNNELVGVTEDDTGTNTTYNVDEPQGLGMHATLGELLQDTLTDTAGVTLSSVELLPVLGVLLDTVSALAVPAVSPVFYRSLADTIATAPTLSPVAGKILREGLAISEAHVANQKAITLLLEAVTLAETLRAGRPLTLAETIGLAEALQATTAVTLAHELGIAELVAPAVTYNLALSQALGLADALNRHVGADAADTVGVNQVEALLRRAVATTTETVGVADTPTPRFLLSVTAADGVAIDPAEVLNMVLAGTLSDGVEIEGAYISPDGSITTWTMNTRTGAVSEYSNFAFNSFARVGSVYLGASEDGLYKLVGDDDAGDQIVSVLKGGFMQFGNTRLSRLKEAYIAATGDAGQFVLRIETLDGATYNYAVDTTSGKNAKVNMGKGQRARYFAYTLTSAGQDFTLDTLEFVPIVVQRRV